MILGGTAAAILAVSTILSGRSLQALQSTVEQKAIAEEAAGALERECSIAEAEGAELKQTGALSATILGTKQQETARLRREAEALAAQLERKAVVVSQMKAKVDLQVDQSSDDLGLKLVRAKKGVSEAKVGSLTKELNSVRETKRQLLASLARRFLDIHEIGAARILTVHRRHGFVTFDLGASSGLPPHATLVATRGGEPVGEIRVTSVEPSSSIGEIISESEPLKGGDILTLKQK